MASMGGGRVRPAKFSAVSIHRLPPRRAARLAPLFATASIHCHTRPVASLEGRAGAACGTAAVRADGITCHVWEVWLALTLRHKRDVGAHGPARGACSGRARAFIGTSAVALALCTATSAFRQNQGQWEGGRVRREIRTAFGSAARKGSARLELECARRWKWNIKRVRRIASSATID